MEKITILIAEDHKLVRECWAHILNSENFFKVIATCGDAESAIEMARQMRPSVVLVNVNIPKIGGFEVTEIIRKVSPRSRVIGLADHAQPAYAKRMFRSGAKGYITKNSPRSEMVQAIIEVNRGKKYLCEEVKALMQDKFSDDEHDINKLTIREIEIGQFIKDGFSSREIAGKLEISLKTVEVHRHNILKKLNIKNSAALVHLINVSLSVA